MATMACSAHLNASCTSSVDWKPTCRTPWAALVAGSIRSGVRIAGIALQKKTWTTADIIVSAVWNHCTEGARQGQKCSKRQGLSRRH